MAQAQGSRVQVAYVVESSFGVTPATPQTQLIDFVNFNGNLNAPSIVSNSIRSDRQIADSRRGNVSTEGSLEVELCPGSYDSFMEAVLQGTWTANELEIGTTQRSYAIEQGFTDIAQYRVFNGSVFTSFSLEVTPNGLVTGSFGFMGSNTTDFSATSIDTTPTAVPVKPRFFHEGGTFKEGGVTVGYLSSITLDLNNNATANSALGVNGVRSITSGRANVSGKVTALFEDVTLYNKFRSNTDSAIEFTLVAGAESLTFLLPKVKYTAGTIPMNSDGPISVELDFQAVYDTVEGTTLKITRV